MLLMMHLNVRRLSDAYLVHSLVVKTQTSRSTGQSYYISVKQQQQLMTVGLKVNFFICRVASSCKKSKLYLTGLLPLARFQSRHCHWFQWDRSEG